MKAKSSTRRRRIVAALVGGLVLAAWICVTPLLADWLVVERPVEKADAIVILSGAADYLQRAHGGASAFRDGIAPRILITDDGQRGGWDDAEKGNPYFVERMRRVLEASGVPKHSIEVLPGRVSTTFNEADLVSRTASERGYKGILVVTSAYHSKRALWSFQRSREAAASGLNIGIRPSPADADYPGRWTWWLTPRGWRTVGAEYVKFGFYWLYC